jgi:Nucleotidyl transferase AbiEii toxin, Type IV TA system
VIQIPPADSRSERLWCALLDLAERVPDGWAIIGGQMVRLRGLVEGSEQPRTSIDIDIVADIRANPRALKSIANALETAGFEPSDAALEADVGHRFIHGDVIFDILAPDNIGRRADLETVGRATTLEVGGGTYALSRAVPVEIEVAGRRGVVNLPDLAGALVIKAVAAARDRGHRGPARHLSDLAFMLTLIDDPIELRETLGPKNCRRIREVTALYSPEHEAWLGLGASLAAQGRRNHALICGGFAHPRPTG